MSEKVREEEVIAWTGALLLSFCSIPEVVKAFKTKHCSLTWTFLLMWFFGEVFILVPVLSDKLGHFLVFNYSFNILAIAVLIFYKWKGK